MWLWSTLKTRASQRRKQKTANNIPVLSSTDQTVCSQTVAPINYGFGNSTIELFARRSIQAILPVPITCNRVKSVALLCKFMTYLRQALARRNQEKSSRKRHGWNVFPVFETCYESNVWSVTHLNDIAHWCSFQRTKIIVGTTTWMLTGTLIPRPWNAVECRAYIVGTAK